MDNMANYKQLLTKYEQLPKHVKAFFDPFPELVENYHWDVSVAYLFSRIELAKNRTIHAAIVKLHHTDSVLTQQLVNEQHMTRGKFYELYALIVGKQIPKDVQKNWKRLKKFAIGWYTERAAKHRKFGISWLARWILLTNLITAYSPISELNPSAAFKVSKAGLFLLAKQRRDGFYWEWALPA